jgi:hypothetical protein
MDAAHLVQDQDQDQVIERPQLWSSRRKRDHREVGCDQHRTQGRAVPAADIDDGQIVLCRERPDLLVGGAATDLHRRQPAAIIDAGFPPRGSEQRGRRLAIGIDQQRLTAVPRRDHGELRRKRALAEAALGVTDADDHPCLAPKTAIAISMP